MSPEMLGWVGGLVGAAVGVLGAALGTYLSLRGTEGPRERAFVARVALAGWVLAAVFAAGFLLMPNPGRHWLWVPYAVLLPAGAVFANRRGRQIRREEAVA